ncbi:MAG: GNAT family N-acetyltransferase [Gemmatimonadota bacterium]|nr:GNAT family N-acetyltransferase [Gemmatimonadota bacterium]
MTGVRSERTGRAIALRVRPATADDLAVVVELRLALVAEHRSSRIYGRVRADAPARARALFQSQLRSSSEVTLLAEQHGQVVGVLRCIDTPGLPLLDPLRYGYISSVYVRPSARRQGALRTLLAEAERWCQARGLNELRLHNSVENPLANASWDALGFEVVEHLRMRSLR